MPKPKKTQRRRQGGIAFFRKRGTVIGIVAPVVIFAFGAYLVAGNNNVKTPTPEPTSTAPTNLADPSVSPSASTNPKPILAASCATGTKGRVEESFDTKSGWLIVQGSGTLSVENDHRQGSFALSLDNGQNASETWAQKRFSKKLDLSRAKELRIWIRQNGNLQPNHDKWRVRLISESGAFFERIVPDVTMGVATTQWCQEASHRGDWLRGGSPSWSDIVAIQVNSPAYGGSGAGNVADYDAFSVVE